MTDSNTLLSSNLAGYQKTAEFSLKNNLKAVVLMNVAGFFLLILSVWLLIQYTGLVRPQDFTAGFSGSIGSLGGMISGIALLLLDIAVMVILHEAVHGLFFWLFTGKRPLFAIRPGYAYAAAPGSFLPRNRYLLVGLAPFVILTLLGLALIPLVPQSFLLFLNVFIVMNFSGAVGDLWVVFWLLTKNSSARIQDFGDRIEVFEPL